ncbi:hypothetical protein EGJ03_15965 [Stenotrophomonas maltophilia]|nr:hypothetical protein EGJ06_08350 [Stenotrophomonas maltophilia]RRU28557.1 hypothetical protein EGJ03_15965 [Stenotrophomonas maltophilia]RRU83743.1 hypothetical protein EGI98_14345 [Stenotrophomonas maltophilia]RRU92466.1 hypothetical protein EGI91_14185 [Stenotrophomonas maltophilia]
MRFDFNSTYSMLMDVHPRTAWIYPIAKICQRWGGVGLQDRWRHGWRHRAPMDGFTACPASPHRPAIPRNACFCCCCCLGLKPLQVQGRRPCRTTLTPRRARPAVAPAWYRAAARRSSSKSA